MSQNNAPELDWTETLSDAEVQEMYAALDAEAARVKQEDDMKPVMQAWHDFCLTPEGEAFWAEFEKNRDR